MSHASAALFSSLSPHSTLATPNTSFATARQQEYRDQINWKRPPAPKAVQKFRLDPHRKGKGEGQERERGEIGPRKSVLGNRTKSGGAPRDVSTGLISALDSGKGGRYQDSAQATLHLESKPTHSPSCSTRVRCTLRRGASCLVTTSQGLSSYSERHKHIMSTYWTLLF